MVGTSDVLEIGLAYSSTGSARSPGGNSYIAQHASKWSGTVSSGKNKCHADCNGDGTVDDDDTLAIYNNFAHSHAFRSSSSGTDIRVVTNQNYFAAGAWNKVDIYSGDGQNALQLYGLSFDINFDNSLIEKGASYLVYTSSFLNANNQNLEFRKLDFNAGKLHAASVRKDHSNVNDTGKIAEFYFKIQEGTEGQFMAISANHSERVDKDGKHTDQAGNDVLVEIAANVAGLAEQGIDRTLKIIPNPAREIVRLEGTPGKSFNYRVTDLSGRILMNGELSGAATLDISRLPEGVYMVSCSSAGFISTERLIIQR
jgi:hypothetical protein